MKILIDNEIKTTKTSMTNEKIDAGAFCDYDETTYICDAIMEIADYHIDIYNHDLLLWAVDNYSYIDDANNELGTPNDFLQQIRQGQYIANEQEIYDNYQNMLYIYCLNLLKENGIEELEEEQLQRIYEQLEDYDHNNKLLDIEDVKASYEE